MTARRAPKLVAAVLATTLVGYFVLKQLSWKELKALGSSADLRLLGLAFGFYFLANVLRAWRFRLLVDNRLSVGLLLRTVLMQNFLNTFLPLRAGEVSYLYAVHQTGAVRPGENLASLVAARVLDLVVALWIPLLILPMSRVSSTEGPAVAWLASLAVAAALGLAVGLYKSRQLGAWLATLSVKRQGRVARVLLTASEMLEALAQLRSGRLLGRAASLTIGCWVLIYACGYASMLGLGVNIRVWDALFAYTFPMLASMMPFYMLGGFGVFEGSIGMGLNLVGLPLSLAMSTGLLLHIAELTYVILPAPLGLSPGPRKARPERV